MSSLRNTSSALIALSLALSTAPCWSQTPAPAINTPFRLPLADGTTVNAAFLRMPGAPVVLAFQSPTGQFFLWTIAPTTDPAPLPIPIVDPPKPPAPTTGLALITITPTTPATISAALRDRLAASASGFFPYTVSMVDTADPPANALRWIGRSAGKPYPYTFLADPAGNVLWEGPTPADDQTLLNLLPCPSGNCPRTRSQSK